MAIKLLRDALIQRRESGWVSLPNKNNQAGRAVAAVAAARVQASDLTDGGPGFLNTCCSDVKFCTQGRVGGGIIVALTPHRALA